MKPELIQKFKELFEEQRNTILESIGVSSEEFTLPTDELMDETDLASTELETSMRIRLRNREALYLKKINEALLRIENGTFGQCEECEEEMETRRLEARPTATLCITCKEKQERSEEIHIHTRRHKSLGRSIRFVG